MALQPNIQPNVHLQVEDDHCSPAENSQRHWVTYSAAPEVGSTAPPGQGRVKTHTSFGHKFRPQVSAIFFG